MNHEVWSTERGKMMRSWWIGALVTLSAPAVALAGTATFAPDLVEVVAGQPAQFDVTVSVETLDEFNVADIIIGANAVTDLTFEYSAEWQAAFANVTAPVYDVGFYTHDVFVGGNNPTAVGTSLMLGTVTIDTTGLTEGDYTVEINSSFDGTTALGRDDETEDLVGIGTVRIVPEPGSLMLLGLVGTILLRRRP